MLAPDLIRAFVVSLPQASARRAHAAAFLDGHIHYEIVDATAGKDLADNIGRYCDSLYCARFFRDLTLNEAACSLSHGKALRRFLDSRARYGLILEDDAYIAPAGFTQIARAVEELARFDILKLGGAAPQAADGMLARACGAIRVIAVTTFGGGAFAYVVTRQGAEKILRKLLPIREPYDAYLRNVHVHRCEIFETSPHLASLHEENNNSTIGGNRAGRKCSLSLAENVASALFRIEYNIGRRLFNLRRFGIAYLTKRRFVRAAKP